tara:strand:+ start:2361 stop:3698 length:1338 start_codon:yes stop_codon:yes gene_type:complete
MRRRRLFINSRYNSFKKTISVDSDKSISIRTILLGSQAYGKTNIKNILLSEDIINSIKCLKKLGIKILLKKKDCYIYGKGLNGFKYKKNIVLNAGNSGTFARLILGLLVKTPYYIKLIGDKSLSQRDFERVITPLRKVGANFKVNNRKTLPLKIIGSSFVNPIHYFENRGSAQCKSTLMLAALNSPGQTIIKAKKSRDHTENIFKYLKIPIIIKRNKHNDEIKVKGQKPFKSFKYNVPSDPSSCAFFIVLTLLSKDCELKIKNVNINKSRIGYIGVLNKMGAKIKIKNTKKRYGEKQADIFVKSQPTLKKINCPPNLNSNLIDEFLIIFLVAAKANGVSKFSNLSELNKKESPRLKLGSELLNQLGIKTELTKDTIKIFGNPGINLKKTIDIKNYYKDHRIFMTSVIAALTFGGKWKISDIDSYKSSFPSFLKIIKKLGYKFNFI